jgi:hypothetical protein
MYELKAMIDPADSARLLDELVLLFEAHDQDCTCGVVGNSVIGYAEEEMLSQITAVILRYAPQVNVQLAVEDEELALA